MQKIRLYELIIILILSVLFIIIPQQPAQAASIFYVSTIGGDDSNDCTSNLSPCLTIEAAIDKAANGDTIQIEAGTYIENITIDKNLTLQGADETTTIIDGNDAGSVITIAQSLTVTISDLTIQNGTASSGGGIYIDSGYLAETTVNLQNLKIQENVATSNGGAIYIGNFGIVTITNSELAYNSASNYGGAILTSQSVDFLISNTVLHHNSAVGRGGAVSATIGEINVEDSYFYQNTAAMTGGALFSNGVMNINRSTFAYNHAEWGGAIHEAEHLNVANSTFSGNISDRSGSAIHFWYSGDIANTTFYGNIANGSTIDNHSGITLHMTNSLFAANTDGPNHDCHYSGVGVSTGSNNLADDPDCPGYIGPATNIDPILKDNGGPTPTHALLPGSNAIDSGLNCAYNSTGTNPLFTDGASITTDQRLYPHTAGCDIGAFEVTQFCTLVTQIPQSECAALETLYSSTGGADWTNNTGWLETTTVCSWHGITCDAGHVTGIQLAPNHLIGTIPSALENLTNLQILNLGSTIWDPPDTVRNQLSGNIPSALGNLTQLQYLNLSWNELGGPIPSDLGRLANLRELWLNNNAQYGPGLSGPIPLELTTLINLEVLDLARNALTGGIPPELGDLSNLRQLSVWANPLGGTIPPELGMLTNLVGFGADFNQLTGSIPPELSSLTNLTMLVLGYNKLSGPIPPEIGDMILLKDLSLNHNQLSGEIPSTLTNLTNLSNSGGTIVAYNALTASDPTLQTFLDGLEPNWATTQTVPPTDLAGANDIPISVDLTWKPILYTADGGYYEVSYATDPGGPWTVGQTDNKTADRYPVAGLTPNVPYYFRVRTHTPAHAGGQQNDLWSDYSAVMLYNPSWVIINEQEVFAELEQQIEDADGQIAFVLADCVPDGFKLTVLLHDGTSGEVQVSVVDSGSGYITIQINAVTSGGLPAPNAFADVVYTELPALLAGSLDVLLTQKLGLDFDLDSLSVLDSGIYTRGGH